MEGMEEAGPRGDEQQRVLRVTEKSLGDKLEA
jgi:hypothetical protein